MMSLSRKNILEALDIVTTKGASKEELVSLISDMSMQQVAITLWRCMQDDLVIEKDDRFYLKEHIAEDKPIPANKVQPYQNGRIALPEIAKNRAMRTVSVYTSPTEETNIVQVQMCINNQWIKLPLVGNLRMCTGPDIPAWSKDQETNQNVSVIRLIRKNGEYTDIQVSRGYPVTIAYEE